MKTLVVSLVALVLAIFVGCQSSITDPAVTDSKDNYGSVYTENFASKDWISSLPGEIDLRGTLQVPGQSVDQFATIDGTIKYAIEKVYFDTPPPAPQSAFKVSLHVNAKITCKNPGNDNVWIVQNTSENLVYISDQNDKVYLFTKTIKVKYACPAPLDIVFKFQVNEKELRMTSMELKTHEGWVQAGDPGF